MSDVEINSNLESKNNKNTNASNEIFITQKNQWEEIKTLISKNIKEIFGKPGLILLSLKNMRKVYYTFQQILI